MATLASFYPYVATECPGAPSPVLDLAIVTGCREFSKATHALLLDTTITTVIAQEDYLPTLTEEEIVSVRHVKNGTSALTPKVREEYEAYSAASGTPTIFSVKEDDPLELSFYPTPSAAIVLSVRLVVMPTLDASTVSDKLYDWYREGVAAYAKYLLMSQVGKPWSNADQAAFNYRLFDARVADARVRRSQWRSDIPNAVQMSPFA